MTKVAFDARWIYEEPSGIGVYARELARRLPALLPEFEFAFLFGSSKVGDEVMAGMPDGCGNVSAKVVDAHPTSAASQLVMPRVLRGLGAALYHSPNYMIPYLAFWGAWRRRPKCIVTIHDIIPLVVEGYAPNSRTSRARGLYRFCLRQSALCADAVITVSERSRQDMARALSLDAAALEKIVPILNGADGAGSCMCGPIKTDSDSVRTLLYVGRMDPYKNVPGLIEAFAIARARVPFPMKLRICGAPDARYPEARDTVARLGLVGEVEFTGFVVDDALARMYCEADLLAHPSLYEGFGLPLVEAMACGLPVICTDGGSQPEVAAGAARIVKAGDSVAMANAIVETITSPARMEKMRAAGLARAGELSWDACAARTAALYRQVAGQP